MTKSKSEWSKFEEVISTIDRSEANKLLKQLEKISKEIKNNNYVKSPSVFQFRIDLKFMRSPIWRRVQIPWSYTFYDFHIYLQYIFAWTNDYLHEFVRNKDKSGKPLNRFEQIRIGMQKDYFGEPFKHTFEVLDEKKEIISHWFSEENKIMDYIYDFRNDWQHTIKLEKILLIDKDSDKEYPKLLKYKGETPGPTWDDD